MKESEGNCMIGEKLSGIYLALEDKYFGLLDWLDSKGIPVYAYSDFLEDHGIPSFPFTVAIIILLIALIFGFFIIGTTINPSITIGISDQYNEALSNVSITVKDAQGKQITKTTLNNGGILKLSGIPIGSTLTIFAEKEGYETAEEEIIVSKENLSVGLQLNQKTELIDARILLQDEITKDPVKGARILATYRTLSRETTSDASGNATLLQIPAGTEILVGISSDAYEAFSEPLTFSKEQLKTIFLSPKSISLEGQSKLLLSIKDEEGNLVKEADITIRDKSTDSILYQATTQTGQYSANIAKNTSIRLIVEKTGFLRYDSLIENESRTMRLDEETWEVILKSGGKKLKVSIATETNAPIAEAVVQLFNLDSELLDSKETPEAGFVEFNDLNGEEKFFATAFAEGYLPERKEIDIKTIDNVTINLKSADATNSSYLAIYVIDSMKAPANNTDLFFFEKVLEQELPLGVPATKTDLSGYASARLAIGTNFLVKAVRDLETGSGEKTIQANTLNELRIQLQKSATIFELNVLDEFENPVNGKIKITSPDGTLLYDGNITNGKVFFDTQGKEKANLEITTDNGKTFSEQIGLKGKNTGTVQLGKEAEGFSPETKFLGIFDSTGKQVEGIVPGEFFWAKFETTWPSGNYKAGLHARIGNDSVRFVDSEEAGILGFDAATTSFAAGKSYQPAPQPGNETADRQNKGKLGEYNKWIELYFEKPSNTTITKIKIKAKESIQAKSIELHYRAWAEIGGKYYRNPQDSELGTEKFVSTKTMLYAETTIETIPIFQSIPECKKELCASYFFLQKNGLLIEAKDFKPVLNETYALEIDLSASKPLNATINLETGIPTLINFTSYDIESFQNTPKPEEKTPLPATTDLGETGTNQPTSQGYLAGNQNPIFGTIDKTNIIAEFAENQNKKNLNNSNSGTTILFADETTTGQETTASAAPAGQGYINTANMADASQPELQQNPFGFTEESTGAKTKLTIPSIAIIPGEIKKIRAYFKTIESGDAFIKTDITAAGTALSKTINFSIPKQKEFLITITPEEILAGKDFTINLKEKETNAEMPNATIHLLDSSGKTAISIIGTGTKGKGQNGNYEFKNNFKPGKYTAEITAQDFVPATQEITIAIDDLLQIAKEIKITIPKGATEAVKNTSIKNKSELEIQGLTYEIETGASFPEEFTLTLELPAAIGAKQDSQATIHIALNLNEDSKDSLYGEAEATITGTAAGQFTSKTKTKIIIDYNKKFSEECLKFDSAELRVKLIGRAGSTAQTQLGIENNCETTVTLTPKIEALENDPNLAVDVSQITIEKDEKQTIPITVSNKIDRVYSMQKTFSFKINFDSQQISKTIPLKAELWNPVTNLSFPPQLSMWLTNIPGQLTATDTKPLYLRNTGQEPITGFRIAVDDTAYKQYGIVSYLGPMGVDYGYLPPGGSLSPARYVVAQTTNNMPLPGPLMGAIHYTGVAMNRQMDFGQTSVSINYPGQQCLKLSAKESMSFQSKETYGVQRKTIIIRNDCGEEIRIRDIKPKAIGNNGLYIIPPDFTIPSGTEKEFFLQLNISQSMNKTEQIRATGFLVRSQKNIDSNPLAVKIEIGEQAKIPDSGMQGTKTRMKVCDSATGEEKEISFPKLGDCTNGYCDAKQLAKLLADKTAGIVKEMRQKSASLKDRAETLPCKDQTYCLFSDMGIKTEGFYAFTQLDNTTPDIIKDVLFEKKITELENISEVKTRKEIIDETDFGKLAATVGGWTKTIYLGDEFKGCGKYFLTIYGAVQIQNNKIESESFMIFVKADLVDPSKEGKRAETEECKAKIQNFANFLPVDTGLNSNDTSKAWPGLIATGSTELEALGETISKQLFKTEKGRTVASGGNTNNLKLELGGNADSIVKLSIDSSGDSSTPKTITANITTAAEKNTKIAEEVAQAINSVKTGNISKETCISADETYILVKGWTTPLADLQISSDKDTIKIFGGESSIELTITSGLDEEVKITTNFIGENGKSNIPGIEYIRIEDEKGKQIFKQFANSTTEGENKIKLSMGTNQEASTPTTARTMEAENKEQILLADTTPPDGTTANGTKPPTANGTTPPAPSGQPPTQPTGQPAAEKPTAQPEQQLPKASAKIKFIIKGSTLKEDPYLNAKGKSIVINASPIDPTQKGRATKQAKEIKIEVCGIHIFDFLKKIEETTPEQIEKTPDKKIAAFATIGWKGAPEEKISIEYLQKKAEADLATKGQITEGAYASGTANPNSKRDLALKKLGATWIGYVIPCSAMALVLNLFTIKTVPDVGFNCIGPAAWTTKDILKDLGEGWKKTIETIESGIRIAIKTMIPFAGKYIANWLLPEKVNSPELTEAQKQQNAQNFNEEILVPAITGVSIRTITAGISNGWDTITPTSAKITANEVSDKLIAELERTTFKDMKAKNPVEWTQLKNSLKSGLSDRIEINLLELQGKAKIGNVIAEVAQKSYGETGSEIANIIALPTVQDKLPPDVKNLLASKKMGVVNKVLPMDGFQAPKTGSITTVDKAQITSFKDSETKKWRNSILEQIKTKLSSTSDGKKLLEPSNNIMADAEAIVDGKIAQGSINFREESIWETYGKYGKKFKKSTITLDTDLDSLNRTVVRELQGKVEEKIVAGTIGKSTMKEFSNGIFSGDEAAGLKSAAKEVFESGTTKTRGEKLLKAIKDFFSKKFWNLANFSLKNLKSISWGLIKGAGFGALEILAGMQGENQWWEEIASYKTAPTNTFGSNATQPKVTDATGKTNAFIGGVTEIVKNETYRIELTNAGKNKKYNITLLNPADNDAFANMTKEVTANPAMLWESKSCSDFIGKEFGYIGNLMPSFSNEIPSEHIIAYWANENNNAFAIARIGNPEDSSDDVPEENIIALMAVQPEKTGCSLDNEWYKKDSATIKGYIECIAAKIRGKQFEDVAKQLGDSKYYNEVIAAREKWGKFKIKAS